MWLVTEPKQNSDQSLLYSHLWAFSPRGPGWLIFTTPTLSQQGTQTPNSQPSDGRRQVWHIRNIFFQSKYSKKKKSLPRRNFSHLKHSQTWSNSRAFSAHIQSHYAFFSHLNLIEALTSETWNPVRSINIAPSTVARQDNGRTFSLMSFQFPFRSWKWCWIWATPYVDRHRAADFEAVLWYCALTV